MPVRHNLSFITCLLLANVLRMIVRLAKLTVCSSSEPPPHVPLLDNSVRAIHSPTPAPASASAPRVPFPFLDMTATHPARRALGPARPSALLVPRDPSSIPRRGRVPARQAPSRAAPPASPAPPTAAPAPAMLRPARAALVVSS
ncbi:hypothetical protein MKEN_00214600 [Mycena kentingensis (nom. inval.)]|nr:hypothetical protein MKEN_00214600 [Mycena kentingensis (nom. inval.)]